MEVTPGNVHDSVPFDDVYDKVVEQFPDVHAFVADSAYKIPHICKKVFSESRVLSTDARYIPIYQRMYKARKETIERVFADAKEKHGMRYTRYTGLAQVTNWVKLCFAAMNLKKFAKWRWKDTHPSYISCVISMIFSQYATPPCLA